MTYFRTFYYCEWINYLLNGSCFSKKIKDKHPRLIL